MPKPNTFEDDPDTWIIEDYTAELLKQLKTATYDTLPGDVSDNKQPSKFLNILYQAGFEFQSHIAYYDMYVPVAVVVPTPRRKSTPKLPPHLITPLSPDEQVAVKSLKNKLNVTDAGQITAAAFGQNAETVNWDLAQIIAGRLDFYWNITKEILENGPELTKIPNSWALNFSGTFLGVAEMSLKSSGVNSPWANVLVSCPAGIVGTLGTTLSAPLGIGVIGLISTLQSFAVCMENMVKLSAKLRKPQEEILLTKLPADNLNNTKGNNFKTSDEDLFFYSGEDSTDIAKSPGWGGPSGDFVKPNSGAAGDFKCWREKGAWRCDVRVRDTVGNHERIQSEVNTTTGQEKREVTTSEKPDMN